MLLLRSRLTWYNVMLIARSWDLNVLLFALFAIVTLFEALIQLFSRHFLKTGHECKLQTGSLSWYKVDCQWSWPKAVCKKFNAT